MKIFSVDLQVNTIGNGFNVHEIIICKKKHTAADLQAVIIKAVSEQIKESVYTSSNNGSKWTPEQIGALNSMVSYKVATLCKYLHDRWHDAIPQANMSDSKVMSDYEMPVGSNDTDFYTRDQLRTVTVSAKIRAEHFVDIRKVEN